LYLQGFIQPAGTAVKRPAILILTNQHSSEPRYFCFLSTTALFGAMLGMQHLS